MSDELDPTTARLVSELASNMLPKLTKSLNSAIPVNEFMSALERTNRTSQDLRTQIDKSIKAGIDDSRAGRSVMLQSLGTVLDEIAGLRRNIDRIPDNLEAIARNLTPKDSTDNIKRELKEITSRLDELTKGIKIFFETYAANNEREIPTGNYEPLNDSERLSENNTRLDRLLNTSLPGLEGLVKAQSTAQSHELEEFSREISTLHEQNNIAMIHEVREAVTAELSGYADEVIARLMEERRKLDAKNALMLKIIAGLSGACAVMIILMMFLK